MVRISRRSLLVGSTAAVMLSALQGVPSGALAWAAQPTGPERLVVAQGAEPASLHPLLETGLVEASAYGNIYDPLVTLDADGRLAPALAESWEPRDERSWSFRLRTGVTFHDGEVFDSESVRSPSSGCSTLPAPLRFARSSMPSSASRRLIRRRRSSGRSGRSRRSWPN